MNITALLFGFALVLSFFPATAAEDKKEDAVEMALREVFTTYKKGDDEAALTQMRALVKIMEEKAAAAVGEQLPAEVGDWKGESMKKDDLGIVGGGISISRVYVKEEDRVTVKVMKDAPAIQPLIALLGNEDLLALSNRKTTSIAGEKAVMEGEHKLQMVLDQRIFVELEGSENVGEKDLVALARKLDLRALSKLK